MVVVTNEENGEKRENRKNRKTTGRTTDEAAHVLHTATVGSRDVLLYTWLAAIPLIIMIMLILFWPRGDAWWLVGMTSVGAITSLYGLVRLLRELVLDVAGFPDFKLPVWSVIYLILYVILGFAYLYFGLFWTAPGRYVKGFKSSDSGAFVDALYLSCCSFLAIPVDRGISLVGNTGRFLTVGQGLISMFINLVIITKFVNAF